MGVLGILRDTGGLLGADTELEMGSSAFIIDHTDPQLSPLQHLVLVVRGPLPLVL